MPAWASACPLKVQAMNEALDAVDQAILEAAIKARESIMSPAIGDFVLFPTGELERFSHDWDEVIQTAPSGSFHLLKCGDGSFSGGLNPAIPVSSLELIPARLPGTFWFFHHGISGAGRGVHCEIMCRVYKTSAPYDGYLGRDFQSHKTEGLKKELALQLCAVQ